MRNNSKREEKLYATLLVFEEMEICLLLCRFFFSFFLDVGTKLAREVTRSKGVQGTEEFMVTFCNQKFVSGEFNV